MKLIFDRNEKFVGVFILGILILMVTTLIIVGRGKDWFKKYVTYYTVFNETYNLKEGAPVKLYKADIGKVTKITVEEDKVKVRLAILEAYASRIHTDTVVSVESPTFIGSEYVAIRPGRSDSPLIPEGGVIPSQAKKSIADILDEFQVEKTAKQFIKSVQDIAEIAEILRDPQGPIFSAVNNINKSIAHAENIMADLEAGKGTLGGLIKSEKLLQRIYQNLDYVESILQHVEQSSAKTTVTIEQVQSILSTFDYMATQIQENIEILRVILNNLEEGSYDIPEITQTFKEGIREIREGIDTADRVFKSIERNILIRPNLPPGPVEESISADPR